jgi:Tol biopolymer transport system component
MQLHVTIFLLAYILLGISSAGLAGEGQRLTTDGQLKRDPIFVNEGEEIVYSVEHTTPRLILNRLRLADGVVTRLHPEASLPELKPSFSRDEKIYTFLAMTGNDHLTLRVRGVSSRQVRILKSSGTVVWNAAITPDGKQVVYNVSGQLILRSLSDDNETSLTKSAGRNDWPNVSADGKRIVFASSRNGDFDIYVMKLDGSAIRRLTESLGLDMRPVWSPDGKQIAFTSNRDGNYEIYTMNADGSNVRRITHHDERDDYPTWHPSGKQLGYVSERDGNYDLYLAKIPEN